MNARFADTWLARFLRVGRDRIWDDLRRPFVTESGIIHYFVRLGNINCLVATISRDQQTLHPLLTSAIKANGLRIIGVWATDSEFQLFRSSLSSDPKIVVIL